MSDEAIVEKLFGSSVATLELGTVMARPQPDL